jgi:hypothetical protein
VWRAALAVSLAVAVLPACSRRKPAEINPIEPSVAFNRTKVPLGSAVEITYTWKLEPGAKKLTSDYRVMVHFLDSHKNLLFEDDHPPTPAVTAWEPGQTYSYKRTKFVPIYPYVGPVEVRMGLYTTGGKGERVALKGEDAGMSEIKVATIEFLPQTENIFIVEKEGWHSPESSANNPAQERTWTKREAVASFKNPKKDVVLYLEADTNFKAFPQPPELVIALSPVGAAPAAAPAAAKAPAKGAPAAPTAPAARGLAVPIANSEVFLKKVRFTAADLGDGDWVDLRLVMNQSFVPKALGLNTDDRELGLLVYHLYVGQADQLGAIDGVVEAGPVALPVAPAVAPAASPATSKSAPPTK